MRSLILLSFLLLPPAGSAHEDPRIRCVMNLRQIAAAKQMLQIDNGLSNGVPCEAGSLTQYLSGGTMPHCPAGGVYMIGPIGAEPTCSVGGHSDAALEQDIKRQDAREHSLVWVLVGAGALGVAGAGLYMARRTANKRSAGDGGIPSQLHAERPSPATPDHERWPTSLA